jgi:hypothetical protein
MTHNLMTLVAGSVMVLVVIAIAAVVLAAFGS